MVNAQPIDINGQEVTDFGYLNNSQNSTQASTGSGVSVVNVYNQNSIDVIIPFAFTSSSVSLTSQISLVISTSFPYPIYLTGIGVEVTGGQAQFYIQIGDVNFNNQNALGTVFTSVNYSWQFPFLPYISANTPINLYAVSGTTGTFIHMSLNGFRQQ